MSPVICLILAAVALVVSIYLARNGRYFDCGDLGQMTLEITMVMCFVCALGLGGFGVAAFL